MARHCDCGETCDVKCIIIVSSMLMITINARAEETVPCRKHMPIQPRRIKPVSTITQSIQSLSLSLSPGLIDYIRTYLYTSNALADGSVVFDHFGSQ